MIIQTDQEGKTLMLNMADKALRYSGIDALLAVNTLCRAIKPLPPVSAEKSPDKGDTHGNTEQT